MTSPGKARGTGWVFPVARWIASAARLIWSATYHTKTPRKRLRARVAEQGAAVDVEADAVDGPVAEQERHRIEDVVHLHDAPARRPRHRPAEVTLAPVRAFAHDAGVDHVDPDRRQRDEEVFISPMTPPFTVETIDPGQGRTIPCWSGLLGIMTATLGS